jgi:putative NADH-flavin reductase
MNVIMFGSTGGIGRHAVAQGLEAGHHVTAIARRPEKLGIDHPNLTVVQGDVLDAAAVAPGGAIHEAMRGQDAVISSLGVERSEPTILYSAGVANIAAAMQSAGVRRILCISASGLDPGPWWQKLIAKPLLWAAFREMYADLVRMEDFVKTTALDWTIVRPPRLTDGPRTGTYQVMINTPLSHGMLLSRADTADFMVQHLADLATFCGVVEIAY